MQLLSVLYKVSGLLADSTGSAWKYLDEANIGGLLAEALTADVQAIFADETGLVGADTAVYLLAP